MVGKNGPSDRSVHVTLLCSSNQSSFGSYYNGTTIYTTVINVINQGQSYLPGSSLVAESLGQSGLAFELGRCARCLSEGSRRCWPQGKRLEGVSQSPKPLLPPQSPFLLPHRSLATGAPHRSEPIECSSQDLSVKEKLFLTREKKPGLARD